MKVYMLAPQGFERWDWRNPTEKGIGGSETQFIECAWRMAARGHEVTCYAPIPDDCPGEWRGTAWKRVEDADTSLPGLWIIHRSPQAVDLFEPRADQRLWHVSQDVIYGEGCGGAYTEERCAKFERIFALCSEHMRYLAMTFPFMADRLCQWSNGIKADEIAAGDESKIPCLEDTHDEDDPYYDEYGLCAACGQEGASMGYTDPPRRDPKRLIWASSPDRGLKALLQIFKRAREFDPELTLHVAYGFDNWNKVIDSHNLRRAEDPSLPPCPQEGMRDEIMGLLKQPGVTWLGRIGQPDLHREFRQAGLWCYPSQFEETSCIACQEAQALGAIPICNPYWACADNVRHGVFITGRPYEDPLCRARYVNALLMLAGDATLQEHIRQPMMEWARETFDWERQVDKWEAWMGAAVPC